MKGQDFRHVGGDELDKLLAGKARKSDFCGGWVRQLMTYMMEDSRTIQAC